MKLSWLQQISVLVFVAFCCFGLVFFLNLNTIRTIQLRSYVITPQKDYNLGELKEGDLITITATPNTLFTLEAENFNLVGTKEYQFDFILALKDIPSEPTQLSCRNVSASNDQMLAKAIELFNEPINLDNYDIFDKEGIASVENKALLEEETKGRFGDLTVLLDCTENTIATNESEIYARILFQSTLVFAGFVVVFRKRLLFITRHIHDKH